MIMLLISFLLGTIFVGVVTWQIVEVLNHSQLFADMRSRLQARGYTWASCPWCVSVHVAFFVSLILVGIVDGYIGLLSLVKAFLLSMAGSRVANFLNDLTYPINRTPKGLPVVPQGPNSPAVPKESSAEEEAIRGDAEKV